MTLAQLLEDPALALIGLCVCLLFACAFMGVWIWAWPRIANEGRAIAAPFRATRRVRRGRRLAASMERTLDRAGAKHSRSPIDA